MKNSNAIFAFALAALLLFSSGCLQQPMPGSGRDSHGCLTSAGYQWCAATQDCYRAWEKNCTAPLVGNDTDPHGCIGSAGYEWCAPLKQCIRPWETSCASTSEVRVLTENFPPFNFEGNNGTVDGRSSEIVRLMLATMGERATIEIMDWPSAYQLALTQPNIALYSTARSPQREHRFKWVGPIGTYDKTLYVKNGSALNITSLEGAKKAASICVVAYDDRQQMLTGLGFINLIAKASDAECLKSLSDGESALWFGSTDTAPYVAAEAGIAQGTAVPALHVESTEIYVAFSNSTPDATVQKWQSALDSMKRDGLYDSMLVFWGSQNAPGSDIDSHGCIGSAGYTWCATQSKCIRPWEATCPEGQAANGTAGNGTPQQLAGNDRDSHGCIGSAGYSWCPELSKCVQPWDGSCPSLTQQALAEQATSYCGNGSTVYTCGQYIKVVSDMPGAGSKFYQLGDYGEPITCPVVAPDYMSPDCKRLLLGNNCIDMPVDCSAAAPAAITDLKDDPNFVGAQLTWGKPDSLAVDYEVYRGNAQLSMVSLIGTTGQTYYNDVFNGGNATYAYFVRARNADGKASPSSNVVYVQQLGATGQPSPGQMG
ncbi:Bacterial extracellular solute-binding proteins, family 3 [uncultured archaeon]|nr:Bacterial extracellular solute-binding proteins, family 3 [uncultured archaeon]